MKKTIISMALLALMGAPGAIAQSGSKGTSIGSTINGIIPEAPVGHRQPRATDVPNETSDVPNEKNSTIDLLAKENANLDKKIKSICRGC
jgi:hypothetical protein